MSGEDRIDISARKKRVERFKRLIITLFFMMLAVPLTCCILLMAQIERINARVDKLALQLAALETSQQQASFAEDIPKVSINANAGQGAAPDADALPTQLSLSNVEEPAAEDVRESGTEESAVTVDAGRKVYLTFDDGPSIYTDRILDILAEYGVKATFFVVGKEDERSQDAIRRLVEEGHTLGMHSYSHRYSEIYASEENFIADLGKLQGYLYELTGVESHFYRFPGGSSNSVSSVSMQELADCLDERDIKFFDWNIASGDGGSVLLSAETLTNNCTRDIEQYDAVMILMHDSGVKPTTVKALPAVIEKILAMEDTAILPITEDTVPIQHIHRNN